MKKLFLVFVIFVVVSLYFIKSVGNIEIQKGTYTVKSGDTISELPNILNLDINELRYKLWLKFFAPELPKLQIGNYTVDKNISLNNSFLNNSFKPDLLEQEITILPGWNIFDIDNYFTNKGIINNGEIIELSENIPNDFFDKYPFLINKTLEGFLYPDTYRISLNAQAKDIVNILLSEFNEKIYKKYSSLNEKKFYDSMIMASIVQKEERDSTNKPIVAGILLKRLNEGISIGADATVCYAYKKTFDECTPSFIGEKIYIKTEYNTRNKLGLPPTPISNFSSDTFDAVINPEKTEYYYYLHDNSGIIHYGKTLNEHNRNKNLYIN